MKIKFSDFKFTKENLIYKETAEKPVKVHSMILFLSRQNAMLLKKAAANSWQHPMTASTISSLGHPVEYIIQPVSGQAKLLRNCSKTPLRISDGPRFHLDIQFGEIPIILCDHQYQAFVKLLEVFNLRFRAQMYQKWRPSVPVKER